MFQALVYKNFIFKHFLSQYIDVIELVIEQYILMTLELTFFSVCRILCCALQTLAGGTQGPSLAPQGTGETLPGRNLAEVWLNVLSFHACGLRLLKPFLSGGLDSVDALLNP